MTWSCGPPPLAMSRPWSRQVAAFGRSDEPGVRAHLQPPGTTEDWVVVEQRSTGRIVSASAGLTHRMVLDGVELPGGQVEYVATDPAHQRQGLVRAQFDWHHRRSTERATWPSSSPASPISTGGSGTATASTTRPSATRRVDRGPGGERDEARSRPGAPRGTDREVIMALDAWPATGLRVVRDARAWDVIYVLSQDNDYEHLFVAERDGRVIGWWRTQHKPEDGRVYLQPSVVDPDEPPATTLAMIADARRGRRPPPHRVRRAGHRLQPALGGPRSARPVGPPRPRDLCPGARSAPVPSMRFVRSCPIASPTPATALARARCWSRATGSASPSTTNTATSARCDPWPASRIPTPTAESGSLLITWGRWCSGASVPSGSAPRR